MSSEVSEGHLCARAWCVVPSSVKMKTMRRILGPQWERHQESSKSEVERVISHTKVMSKGSELIHKWGRRDDKSFESDVEWARRHSKVMWNGPEGIRKWCWTDHNSSKTDVRGTTYNFKWCRWDQKTHQKVMSTVPEIISKNDFDGSGSKPKVKTNGARTHPKVMLKAP